MLLTELDGFLTGLLVSPEPIAAEEWMTMVWGTEVDGVPPFDDPLDVKWFAAAVAARRDEIARDLVRGRLQPILDVDERDGEVLWEGWIDGFAEAIGLRPDAFQALADDPERSDAWARLSMLIDVARDEGELDSVELNALQDRAVIELTDAVQRLYPGPGRVDATIGAVAARSNAAKIGRNDPCPCGSGKKHKRCCG